MLVMGWDGTEITPQIRHLIEEHHLGTVLLTAKNLKCEASLLCPVFYLLRGFHSRRNPAALVSCD